MNAALADFHSHLIPGVDDGAENLDASRKALTHFRDQGVTSVITTPHVVGSLVHQPDALAQRLGEIDAGWEELRTLAAGEFPEMRIERGAEVMFDTPSLDLSDARLRLAGTGFALLEFPFFQIPPASVQALIALLQRGWRIILAHPERYVGIRHRLDLVQEWRAAGIGMQVNTGSMLGRYGPEPRSVAIRLLEQGWADYLCSDYHAHSRPTVKAARDALLEMGADEQATLLFETNAGRLLDGHPPYPVPPITPKRGLWRRIRGAFS